SSAVLGMTSPEAVVCAAWSDLATTRASRGLMEPDMRLTLSGRDVTLREFLGSGPVPDRRRGAERGGSLRQPLALSAVDCQRGNCRTSAGTHARRVLNRGVGPARHLAREAASPHPTMREHPCATSEGVAGHALIVKLPTSGGRSPDRPPCRAL